MAIEPFYAIFGERIRAIREARNLTQEALGALLSPAMTRASIANMERGKQRVRLHRLPQLVEALGCSLDDLVVVEPGADQGVREELAKKLPLSDAELGKLLSKIEASRVVPPAVPEGDGTGESP